MYDFVQTSTYRFCSEDREPSAADSRSVAWQARSKEFRRSHALPMSPRPWTACGLFRGCGISLTSRVRDLLDNMTLLACAEKSLPLSSLTGAQIRESVQGHWLDVSQCVTRHKRARLQECVPTFTTSTELYSFSHDRVVLGREMLQMHGHARDLKIPADVPESAVKDLAGQGIALPCLGSVLWALYLCKGFPAVRSPEGSDSSDVELVDCPEPSRVRCRV